MEAKLNALSQIEKSKAAYNLKESMVELNAGIIESNLAIVKSNEAIEAASKVSAENIVAAMNGLTLVASQIVTKIGELTQAIKDTKEPIKEIDVTPPSA